MSAERVWEETTLGQLYESGRKKLEESGVPDVALDARLLLLEAFDLNFASFLTRRDQPLFKQAISGAEEIYRLKQAAEQYEQAVLARAERIPLQHLTGCQCFMGLEFKVNEWVLIPRQDTETLVERVLEENRDKNSAILDVCTGSGCIAISLVKLGEYRSVTALDISKEALKVAEANRERILGEEKERLRLIKSDMFEGLEPKAQFDVIVSNPPYIPSEVIRGLEPEVRDHEPLGALDGKEDGLYFYRILAEQCGDFLNQGGSVYFETGHDQGAAVKTLLESHGFQDTKVIKDLAGMDRVVRGTWPGKIRK